MFRRLTSKGIERMEVGWGISLGFEFSAGPLTIVNFYLRWSTQGWEEILQRSLRSVISRSSSAAKGESMHRPLISENYAFREQDVVGGRSIEKAVLLERL